MLTPPEKADILDIIENLRRRPAYGEREGLWRQRTLSALQTALGPIDNDDASRLRGLAQDEYHCEGSLEIDDHAVVSSSGDGGAYVQAWVWVEDPCAAST